MILDPPADPFGDEKQCPICDTPLEYDAWTNEWYCPAAETHPVKR